MSVSVTRQGSFFNSGPISWSALRQQFRAANIDGSFDTDNNAISVSELYRNTNNQITDPLVPDCQENTVSGPSNNGVPTSGSFAISRVRNTFKYYFVTQSNFDQNVDFDALTNFQYQTNLNRNIRKIIRVNGLITSQNTISASAQFYATASNVRIEIAGQIWGHYGAGGSASPAGTKPEQDGTQGGAGGAAFNLDGLGGNNNVIFLGSTANVYGGGGGGRGGKNGTLTTQNSTSWGGASTFEGTGCKNDGGKLSCERAAPDNLVGEAGCQGGYGGVGTDCSCGSCVGTIQTVTNKGGGQGTNGRGAGNLTASLAGGASEGGTAENGGNGGDWGTAGNGSGNELGTGGAGGASFTGTASGFTISGTLNNSTIRGSNPFF